MRHKNREPRAARSPREPNFRFRILDFAFGRSALRTRRSEITAGWSPSPMSNAEFRSSNVSNPKSAIQYPKSTRASGFTLLEVVVAVALLGIILAAGMELLAIGLRSAETSGDYSQAVILARQKIEGLSLQEPKPQVLDGTLGGYRWSAEVAPEAQGAEGLPAQLFRVRVKVSWAGRGGEKGVELVSLRTALAGDKPSSTVPAATLPARAGRPSPGGR